jgi:hypothetical protein
VQFRAAYVPGVVQKRNAYIILVRKALERLSPERLRRRLKENIKMDLGMIGSQDRIQMGGSLSTCELR